MTTPTSWTAADVARLEAAIKRGVKVVQYQTGRVEYHTLQEMLLLLDRMRADVDASSTSTSQVIYAGRIR